MIKRFSTLILLCMTQSTFAGYVVNPDSDIKVEIGGRAVLQYHSFDIEEMATADISGNDFNFRRIRPYIKVKFNKQWDIKLAYEMGDGNDSVKDAYVRYRGIDWLNIKLGNETLPFSRERMTSSARQHSPERTLVGDTEFGVPGRQPGIHMETDFDSPFKFYLSYASANIHGDLLTEIQFISPISNSRIEDRMQDEGKIGVFRMDFDIWNGSGYRQGDFNGSAKDNTGLTFSLAIYDWDNTHDLVEIERSEGVEVALAYRGFGISIDAQYNDIHAESPFLIDRPLFIDGVADLQQFSIEGGYMLLENQLEIFASSQTMAADKWLQDWNVWEIGVNYFFKKHNHKLQLSYRDQENKKGKLINESAIFLQWQYNY